MVRYNLGKRVRVFMYDTHVNYGFARKCRRKCRRKFREERVSSRQTIRNLVNKLTTTGLVIDNKQKPKRRVLTEEKLDDMGTRLEQTTRKLLKRIAQETGLSKSNARTATQLPKPSRETWCLVCC
jgi:transposase